MKKTICIAAVITACFVIAIFGDSGTYTVSGTATAFIPPPIDAEWPLRHVYVGLYKQSDLINPLDEVRTDENGHFVLETDQTPAQFFLRFRSTNNACVVAQWDPVFPHEPPTEYFVDHGPRTFSSGYTFGEFTVTLDGPLEQLSGAALWLAGEVYGIWDWFRFAANETPDPVLVVWPSAPTYYGGGLSRIYICPDYLTFIYHEYGHFLQDVVPTGRSWIDFPYYCDDISGPGHFMCERQCCVIWPYFEGFAHLVGALSYEHIYHSLNTNNAFGPPPHHLAEWIEDPSWHVGTIGTDIFGNTSNCGTDYWDDPLHTEAAVAAILFDLVDANDDGECANISFEELWAVIAYQGEFLKPDCAISGDVLWPMDHPVTLEDFIDAYLDEYLAPYPDLWSALDANNLDPNYYFEDTDDPDPPQIWQTSHKKEEWVNSRDIQITFRDGDDDASGVCCYSIEFDEDPSTNLYGIGGPSVTHRSDCDRTVDFTDYVWHTGEYWLHYTTRDQSGKWDNDPKHYGPILVDITEPYVTEFLIDGKDPDQDQVTLLISDEVQIKWQVRDDDSGVSSVSIKYEDRDPYNPSLILQLHEISYSEIPYPSALYDVIDSWDWEISPPVIPTNKGVITITVTDVAGNSITWGEPDYDNYDYFEIRGIFDPTGAEDVNLPSVGPGDLAWADFNGDGNDDLAYLGTGPNDDPEAGILKSNGSTLEEQPYYSLPVPLKTGALAWADFNGDGRLDLFTMGRNASGATEAHFYFQEPDGDFDHQPTSYGVAGTIYGDVAVGDLDNDGDLDMVVVGWRRNPKTEEGEVHFTGYEWDRKSNLFTSHTLIESGLMYGEVLLIDYDDDYDKDIVFAGRAINGELKAGGLINKGNWNFSFDQNLADALLIPLNDPRLDAGDFDEDGLPDIVILGLSNSGPSGFVFCNKGGMWEPDQHINLSVCGNVCGGDVTFVDIDNDGDLDVTAVGWSDFTLDYETEWWINRSSGSIKRELIPVEPYVGSSFAWGDVDDDKDLDLVIMGESDFGPRMALYKNQASQGSPNWVNYPPKPPENLHTHSHPFIVYQERVRFGWKAPLPQAPYEELTPVRSLTYDLKVGSSLACIVGYDVDVTSLNNDHSGAMPVVNGNTGFGTEHTLKLAPGKYYWTVRAVDGGWQRSEWAEIQEVTVYRTGIIEAFLGDVTDDESIDVLDVLAVINHILGTAPLEKETLVQADCNGDGQVNVVDVLGIVNVILGISAECMGDGAKAVVTPETVEFLKSMETALSAENYDRLMTLVKAEMVEVPAEFSLAQNYPNPFNPSTDIRYQIADSRSPFHTTLKIYNILGQEVRTLVDEVQEPGYYMVTWDGKDSDGRQAASGVYFYRLTAGDFTATKRMVLMK